MVKKTQEKAKAEHEIISVISKLLEQVNSTPKTELDQKLYNIAFIVFNEVTQFYVAKRGILHIQNHVLLEKVTYDQMVKVYLKKGSQLGANAAISHFQRMSLWQRLRCAFSGRIG